MADFVIGVYVKVYSKVTFSHQFGLFLHFLHRAGEGTGQQPGKYKHADEQDQDNSGHLHNSGVQHVHYLGAVILHHQAPAHISYRCGGSQAVGAVAVDVFHGGSLAGGGRLDRQHGSPVGDGFNEFLLRVNHDIAL